MPHLQNSFVARRGLDQFSRGGGIVGDGLLDQDVQAQFDQATSDIGVGDGWRRDDGGVGATRKIFQRCEYRAIECSRALRVKIEDAGELCLFVFPDDANVIPAERTGSDDCNARFRHLGKRLTRLMESMRTADFIATCVSEYWPV